MNTLKPKHFHFVDDTDIASMTLAVMNRVEHLVTKTAQTIRTWENRSRERRKLLDMGDHLLNDIGKSNIEVKRETGKYFWEK